MNAETKICQNCKKPFAIEPDDFAFYEQIKVPPPTWCPKCRRVRRMLWRNTQNLHKKKDAKTGALIFSQFTPESPVQIYEADFWKSDDWDPYQYGREYDFKKPFFEQFKELLQTVPLMSRFVVGTFVNSDYCMNGTDLKNCYLIFATTAAENSSYGVTATYCKECMDIYSCIQCELCYECTFCTKCYRTMFSLNCEGCQNVWFSRDCVGCTDCFGCANLRNKSYCFLNEQLTKEEYSKKIDEFKSESYRELEVMHSRVAGKLDESPRKFVLGIHNTNVTGNAIFNSKNVLDSYRVWGGEDCSYCQDLVTPVSKDCRDVNSYGANLELAHECCSVGGDSSRLLFSCHCETGSQELSYCYACRSSSNLFGCISLKKAEYSILNKKYTKEEYEALVPKIIEHMNAMPYIDKKGRVYKYGEFFPSELSPFSYNTSLSQDYFPITKEEAISWGYSWYEQDSKAHTVTKDPNELADDINDVNDDILNEVISCEHKGMCTDNCTVGFKITPKELEFYRRMKLPLPHLCFYCRQHVRFLNLNPLKLWHRQCQCAGAKSENGIYRNTVSHQHGAEKCPNEFETSYAPERKEIVYCEQCYQAEVV